ncbi:SGNH/GDSL hydrolase family protein [Paenibacillus sp. FJAT-27812]|uniref:SGNH/GDSL hydrolase family protein n=1 Tax=Paenibacillus sp. FJAT-27812 TaxID=1684143 RepID=UPI0006A762C7|nr:SGNH/GDSL hydrolase family protein [Paenibacillus sp. FJAT-27812]
MIYTALGDSITFGENASSWAKAYPQLAVSALNSRSRSRKFTGYVIARPGWSSNNLLNAVIGQGSPIISQSDAVSIWIGGVDLANAALYSLKTQQPIAVKQSIANYSRNLSAMLAHIRNRSHAQIVCCTQYNPFPNSPLAIESIDRLNQTTYEVAQSYRAKVAPAHAWFEGKQADLIYGYRKGKMEDALSGFLPIHPNDSGHRVIATGLTPYLIPRN